MEMPILVSLMLVVALVPLFSALKIAWNELKSPQSSARMDGDLAKARH